MKVNVEKALLVQVLQRVQSISDRKAKMPILSNVLIKASEASGEMRGVLEFTTTDLELSLRTHIEADIPQSGGTTVSARRLLDIVRELPGEQVTLEELPNNKLLIRSGRSRFELATLPPEDFPFVPDFSEAQWSPCDVAVLRKALTKTLYAIPSDDDPFSVAGLYCHPVESSDLLRFVSSDGHRLAYYETSRGSFPGLDLGDGIILARKGVQEILRLVEKETEGMVSLYENSFLVKTTMTLLSIRLMEADFPEYQLIIPEERPSVLAVDWESFTQTLRRLAVLTTPKWRHVRLAVSSGMLELEVGNPEEGNGYDSLDVEYEGEAFSVAFNIRYVMDAVQSMESPRVLLQWVDQFHGGVLIGSEEEHSMNLIMPMVV